MTRSILSILLLSIILSSIATPYIMALAVDQIGSSEGISERLKSDPWFWSEIVSDEEVLKRVIEDIIPVNGSSYDPVVEKMFWETIVPRGYADHFYEELLFNKLIPEGVAGGYYYNRFFRDIIAEGYRVYMLNRSGEPFVGFESFLYYHLVLFGHLIPENYSNSYYYMEVFYNLYTSNKWGYQEILAWIAYRDEFGPFYATTLTRIDLERLAGNIGGGVAGNGLELDDVVEPGKIVVKLYGPSEPLSGVLVGVYVEPGYCSGGYCGGDLVGSGVTNESGWVEITVPPGYYELRLGGRAYGVIDNIVVYPDQTLVVEKLLGLLNLTLLDSSGGRLYGVSIDLRIQEDTSLGPKPGKSVGYLYIGSNGYASAYVVAGEYMIKPLLPYYDKYISGITIEAGVESNYTYTIGVVKTTITLQPPASNTVYFSFKYHLEKPYGVTYGSDWDMYSSGDTEELWLEPGEYTIAITEIYTGGLSIYTSIRYNFTVGYTDTDIVIPVPALKVDANLVDGAELKLTVYQAIDSNGSYIRDEVGTITISSDRDTFVLPYGNYRLVPIVGYGSENYSFIVNIVDPILYTYELSIPLGYLNLSIVYNGSIVGGIYYIYTQPCLNPPCIGEYVDIASSGELTPLTPGFYAITTEGIGLNEPVYNLSITSGSITEYCIGVGKLVVNATTYNYTGADFTPILVFPMDTETGEPDWNNRIDTLYVYNGVATTYLVPGMYAVVIPGANVSYYWWTSVGYGETVLNVSISEANETDTLFHLGRLHVDINTPYSIYGEVDLYFTIYTVKYVDGEPVPDKQVDYYSLWSLPGSLDIDLTPGEYIVGLEASPWSEETSFLENTSYIVNIEPNGIARINYTFGIVRIDLTLANGEPVTNAIVGIIEEENTISSAYTSSNGSVLLFAPQGSYEAVIEVNYIDYTLEVESIAGKINVYNYTVPTGCLKVVARGYNGYPIENYEVEVIGSDWSWYSGYTDSNGVALFYIPVGNYTIYPEVYPYNYTGLEVGVVEGETRVVYLDLSTIAVYIDTPVAVNRYVPVYIYNNLSSRAYYMSLLRQPYYIHVYPGEYYAVIPGEDTPVWGSYGYGETIHLTIGSNSYREIHFNLTAIVVQLNTNTSVDRVLYVRLYDYPIQYTYSYIASQSITPWSGVSPSTMFLVTPGVYSVVLYGPPYQGVWSSYGSFGHSYTWSGVEASMDNIPFLAYNMSAVGIRVVDGETPVANANVYIYALYNGGKYLVKYTTTDSNGKAYAYLTAGKYLVESSIGARVFTIGSGEFKEVIVEATMLNIYVKGPSSEPVDAVVYIYDKDMVSCIDYKHTDDNGLASFTLIPGNYTIVLRGLNYFYSKDDASMYSDELFGYGYSKAIELNESMDVVIKLNRIDVYIDSPDGPVDHMAIALYDNSIYNPLKGLYSNSSGYASFYVSNGSYTLVLLGYNYGYSDYYYLGFSTNDLAGYGGIIGSIDIGGGSSVYSLSYSVAELIACTKTVDGRPIEGTDTSLYVYTGYWRYIRSRSTDSLGCAVYYVTTGYYGLGIGDYGMEEVNITSTGKYYVNKTLIDINVTVIGPEGYSCYGPDTVSIYFYKVDENGDLGDLIEYDYVELNTTVSKYLPVANGSIAVVIPGYNSTGAVYGYGYGDRVDVNVTSSDRSVVFYVSRIAVRVLDPYGPVNGMCVNVYPSTPGYGGQTDYTDYNGYAEFLVTRGPYMYYIPNAVPEKHFNISVDGYGLFYTEVKLSLIDIKHLSTDYTRTLTVSMVYNGVRVYTAYVYHETSIHVYSGLFTLETTTYNGYIVNKTVDIGYLDYKEVVFKTGGIHVWVKKVDDTNVSEASIALYTQSGTIDNPDLGSYVYSVYIYNGYAEFTVLTSGYYALVFPMGSYTSYGYPRSYFNVPVTGLNTTDYTIVLGRLVVKLVDASGQPVEGKQVELYTVRDGSLWWSVASGYTDSNGTIVFDVTSGEYALDIETLGVVYGVNVVDGEVRYATYTIEPADLAVTNISWTPLEPGDGDTVIVTANITNYGPGTVYTDFLVSFYLNNTLVEDVAVHGLIAGYSTLVSVSITAIAGVDEIRVVVDRYNMVADGNRSNNEMTRYINVLKPDPYIVNASLHGELVDGAQALLEINISNLGPSSTHRCVDVAIYHNSVFVREFSIQGVDVGEYIDLSTYIVLTGGLNVIEIYIDPDNSINEVNESNNYYRIEVYIPKPDLAVSNVSIYYEELVEGRIAVINATVSNIGAGDTLRSFTTKLYIDGKYMASSYYSGGLRVGEKVYIVFYTLIRGGRHNITIAVDTEHNIPDSNWSNNNYYIVWDVPAPDIEITWIDYPSVVNEGEEFNIVFNITNTGVGDTVIDFYVDLVVDGVKYESLLIENGLSIGETVTRSYKLSLTAGEHTIEIIADPEERTGDSNRSNNIVSLNITALYSDLEAIGIELNASEIHYGAEAILEVTIRNNGPGLVSKPFYIAVFSNESFIKQKLVNQTLDVGEETVVDIPITLETGSREYTVVVDDHYMVCYGYGACIYKHRHEIGDPNRSNNNASILVYVPGPDLIVTNITISPEQPIGWGWFTVNVTIKNIGDYRIDELPWTQLLIDNDEYLLWSGKPLDPGEETVLSILVDGYSPGYHSIIAHVDPYMEATEHSEDNNVYNTTLYIPYPDLEVVGVYVNSSTVLDHVSKYNVTVAITNNGADFIHDFHVAIVLPGSGVVREKLVYGGLNNSQTVNITFTLLTRPPGNLSYRVIVDSRGEIPESCRDNNYMEFTSPLTRSLDSVYSTYTLWLGVVEDDMLRIVNNGGVPLNITNITFSEPWITIDTSILPVSLSPREYIDIPFHVDTASLGLGYYETRVFIETNTSYTLNTSITVSIVDPDNMFTVRIPRDTYEVSYLEHINVIVNILSSYYPSESYTITLTGNATAMLLSDNVIHLDRTGYCPIPLYVAPENVSEGYYVLDINVSIDRYGMYKTLSVSIIVHKNPLLLDITPQNNSVIPSTTLALSWTTNVETNATIYFRDTESPSYTVIKVKEVYKTHSIVLGGLQVNHTYEYYLVISSECGSLETGLYRISVKPSVGFTVHEINISVVRDYNQVFEISIRNYDSLYSHRVMAWIVNPYPELVLNFVGKGSIDEELYLLSGGTADLTLVIHTADTSRTNYTVKAVLLNLDNNVSDVMVINIFVREPVFNVEVKYLGMDNNTLVQTYELINHGDTITDLSVHLEGPIEAYVYVYPSINHARLEAGETLVFYLIPILNMLPSDPSLLNGSIVVETRDPSRVEFSTKPFKPPKGYQLYKVIVRSMSVKLRAHDWYCTNRPRVSTKFRGSIDPSDDGGATAILIIRFNPTNHPQPVRPHDGTIYVNGVPVYSWTNTIPSGEVSVEVPFDILGVNPSGGLSEITIDIETRHMNGGHYVVATDFELYINVKGGAFYVMAHNYEEAMQKVYKVFRPDKTAIVPLECEEPPKPPYLVLKLAETIQTKELKFDIARIRSVPDILKNVIQSAMIIRAELRGYATIQKYFIDIGGYGKLRLITRIPGAPLTQGIEGQLDAKATWKVENCEWKFKGGEITGTLFYYRGVKFPLPETWVKWINGYGIKLKAGLHIGISEAKISLNERFKIKSLDSLLVGVRLNGRASLKLEDGVELGLEITIGGDIGWYNNSFGGKILVGVKGDVQVDLGIWEYTYSGEYGVKFLWTYTYGWEAKPFSDPGGVLYHYYYYPDQLGYPYIALAENYTSSSPSLSYLEGKGLVAVWIASDNVSTKIMYTVYTSGGWSTPEEIPAPENLWYTGVKSCVVDGKLVVVVSGMEPFDPTGMDYYEIMDKMNNRTLYYTVWDSSSWSTLTPITDSVSGLYDLVSTGDKAVLAWKQRYGSGEAIGYSFLDNMVWSPPAIITDTQVSNNLSIRDIAVGYMDGKPFIAWTQDVYHGVANDSINIVTWMYYTVYSNGVWSEPVLLENNTSPWSLDIAFNDNSLYIAYASSDQEIYVLAYNGSWRLIGSLGTGFTPETILYGDRLFIVTRTYYNVSYLDIGLYVLDTSTLRYTQLQNITYDKLEDRDFSIASYNGKVFITWTRRRVDVENIPENYTYAYGLYYTVLSSIELSSVELSTNTTVQGTPVEVSVNITNYGDINTSLDLIALLNNTVVYNKSLTIEANKSTIIAFNITVLETGQHQLEIRLSNINPPTTLPVTSIYRTIVVTPFIDVEYPLNNSFVEDTIPVNGTVYGINPADIDVYIYRNNTLVNKYELEDIAGPWSIEFNTTTLSDGPVEVIVNASILDGGVYSTTKLLVYIDNTAPVIEIETPLNNSYVSGLVNITLDIHDTYYSLPSKPLYRIDYGEWSTLEGNNNTYYLLLDTTSYLDGAIVAIEFSVTDQSGKTTTALLRLIVDNSPPETTCNATTKWYNHDVVIALTPFDNVSGVNNTYYRVDGREWLTGTIVVIPAPSDHSNDGVHVIEYYSIDNVGNIEPTRIAYVYIDTEPPQQSVSGLVNGSYVHGEVVIDGEAYEQYSGIQYIKVYLDGEYVTDIDVTDPYNMTWTVYLYTQYLEDGEHVIGFKVVDKAGNTRWDNISFIADNTPPSAEILSPQNNSLMSGLVTIEFNYSDAYLDTAYLIIGGVEVNVTGLYSYVLDTTMYPDGELLVTLGVYDKAGNYREDTIVLVIDNTPPYALITSPSNNTIVSGNITIEFTYSDQHLDKAYLVIDGVAIDVTGLYSYVLDTTTLSDGVHSIVLNVTDQLGHYTLSHITIVADNTEPQALISTPMNWSIVSGVVTIEFNYSDAHLDKALLYINNTVIDVTGSYSFSWDTSSYCDGVYRLLLVVNDTLGHVAVYTVYINR